MKYMDVTAKTGKEYDKTAAEDTVPVKKETDAAPLHGRQVRIRLRYIRRYLSVRTALLTLLAAVAIFTTVVYLTFDVRRAYVIGSDEFYSKNEIVSLITQDHGSLGLNTMFLALYYHGQTSDIPFIESIDVTMVSPTSINVKVTEKDIVGRISVNGKWVYISSTGIAQEYTSSVSNNIPVISGLDFKSATLGGKVVTENPAALAHVLDALDMLSTYDISADSLAVTDKGVTLTFDGVDIAIGTTGYDLKVQKIRQILPYLSGREGTIDLTSYTQEDENIILEPKND